MDTLIKIPQTCMVRKEIKPEAIFTGVDNEIRDSVSKIIWLAKISPEFCAVEPVLNEKDRYEEIQIFDIEIKDPSVIYEIARPIYTAIKYPCILIFKYSKKYTISACPFNAGKIDYDKNILKSIRFTHWIYPDIISAPAQKFIDEFNAVLNSGGNLKIFYENICHSIDYFLLSGITKERTSKILFALLGKKSCSHLLDNCTPHKKFLPKYSAIKAKYNKSERSAMFQWRYDTEDIWYALMSNESTRKILLNRRYRDIDDLIYSLEIFN